MHTCLSGLLRAGRVTRPRRAVYALAEPAEADTAARGVKPVTVRSTLTTFGMVVQSFVDQGTLPRNVIALVERPADAMDEDDTASGTAKSWTVAEVETFRESVRDERLFACWLLSCYGLRRVEVLGLRWSQLDGDALRVRRGRVAVGNETEEGLPKSSVRAATSRRRPSWPRHCGHSRQAEGRGTGARCRVVRRPADRRARGRDAGPA